MLARTKIRQILVSSRVALLSCGSVASEFPELLSVTDNTANDFTLRKTNTEGLRALRCCSSRYKFQRSCGHLASFASDPVRKSSAGSLRTFHFSLRPPNTARRHLRSGPEARGSRFQYRKAQIPKPTILKFLVARGSFRTASRILTNDR
jgi:hypothetical protein